MRLRIGTRKSILARAQTELVTDRITSAIPDIEVQEVIITTSGDIHKDISLKEIGGKGLFIKEIEKALSDGEIDVAVHSGKDLPSCLDEKYSYYCIIPRENPADVIISTPENHHKIKIITDNISNNTVSSKDGEAVIIGTASPRRQALIKKYLPKCTIKLLRGNVPTRIQKLRDNEYDAIILAAAGINRLYKDGDLSDLVVTELPPEIFIPAAAQGIIVCEVLKTSKICDILAGLIDENAQKAFELEKTALASLNADCNDPAGAYARLTPDGWSVKTFFQSDL